MKKKLQDVLWWLFLILAIIVMFLSGSQIIKYLKEGESSQKVNQHLINQAVSERTSGNAGNILHEDQMATFASEPELMANELPNSEILEGTTQQGNSNGETFPDVSNQPWIQVNFDALKQENDDIVAWLYCPGTPVNYPVVQAEDNEYYLRRLVNGEANTAGTLFLDCRNWSDFSDQNSVIHGHHMKNNTMFGTLDDYSKQSYYEKHPVWQLLTPEKEYMVELIAGYVTNDASSAYQFGISVDEKVDFLEESIRLSDFRANVDWEKDDLLVTFSTCSYEYDAARYVVIGILKEVIQ